jgi:hypothetical protein
MLADFMRMRGVFAQDDYKAPTSWRAIIIVALLVIPVPCVLAVRSGSRLCKNAEFQKSDEDFPAQFLFLSK